VTSIINLAVLASTPSCSGRPGPRHLSSQILTFSGTSALDVVAPLTTPTRGPISTRVLNCRVRREGAPDTTSSTDDRTAKSLHVPDCFAPSREESIQLLAFIQGDLQCLCAP
jgi:hypothetical protein